jgi:hypothetical protein
VKQDDSLAGERTGEPGGLPVYSSDARKLLRQMVQHEDELRNQRLGYFLTLNGFLFAGLGFAWKSADAKALVTVLALLGFAISLSAFASMNLSTAAIKYLRDRDPASQDPASQDPARPVSVQSPLGDSVADKDSIDNREVLSIPVAISSWQVSKRGQSPKNRLVNRLKLKSLQPWDALPTFLSCAWLAILVVGWVTL